jgi:tetratricopeptide (TPR) repeat protein
MPYSCNQGLAVAQSGSEARGTDVTIDRGTDHRSPSYRAFVSYSHADKIAAKRFHQKLENYRLPKHLRTIAGVAPHNGRIGRVFRDREDLPAAEDLTSSVKQALAVSKVLIVLCSPSAKASSWVAREIALFRELHPDRPILLALLRGEPDESFPGDFRQGREPLAADLRKQGDGPKLGFLKVVAGVAGVPLDALIQRDSQRQLQRVMAVTGLVGVIAVAMGVMTAIALQARSEAQDQRASAEGLIEFMLTDLREDLNGAAGIAVMTKVNQRALSYYETQRSLSDLAPDSLSRRARVIGRLGEDAMNRRDFELARRNFEERVRTTNRLLEEDPNNVERKFDHALSLNGLAILSQFEGKNEQAESQLHQSWTILSDLKSWTSEALEWRRATTLVSGNLCAIDVLNNKANQESLLKCRLAVELGQKLAANDNEPSRSSYDLVFNLTWYSVALQQFGQVDEARRIRREAITLTDRLVLENPANRKIKAQRMETYGYLATFEPLNVRATMLEAAITTALELTALDPDHAGWTASLRNYQRKLKE